MQKWTIVRLSKKDSEQLIDLDKASFVNYDLPAITKEEIAEILKAGFILGIKEKGTLICNIQFAKKVHHRVRGSPKVCWYVAGIATRPGWQGMGLADLLLKKALAIAKKKADNAKRNTIKITKIEATIRPCNTKSMNLFRKNGFRRKKLLRDYYGKGKDRVLFELILLQPSMPSQPIA